MDCSIALCSKTLTLPIVYALILPKLLIPFMCFLRLSAAIYTETAHECTKSKVNAMRHTGYVVSQSRPHDSRGLKGCLQFPIHCIMGERVSSRNSKQTTVSKLKTMNNFLHIYGKPWSSMLTLDLLSLISIQKGKRICNQPHWMKVVLMTMPNFNSYNMQCPM